MTATPPLPVRVHRAFTLVELLVVISIIGILMGLALTAVGPVMRKSRNTAIRFEVNVLGDGLEAYKLRYGSYPPDFSDWSHVERHFRKAFPQIDDEELKILAQFTHLDANFQRVPIPSAGTPTADPRGDSTYAHYRQCIDAAEALVFCLGGFSSDAKRPFTGDGGPLSLVAGINPLPGQRGYFHYQCNLERANNDFDFDSSSLSVVVANDPADTNSPNPLNAAASVAYTYSNDEFESSVNANSGTDPAVLGDYSVRAKGNSPPSLFTQIHFLVDPFPVFRIKNDGAPIVYFSSPTYRQTFTPATTTGGWTSSADLFHNLNCYFSPDGEEESGVARPYLSDQLDTNAGGFYWVGDGTYQLICAGEDESFGGSIQASRSVATDDPFRDPILDPVGGSIEPGVVDPNIATTARLAGSVTQFPTGRYFDAAGTRASLSDKYGDDEHTHGTSDPQLDNIASFSNLTFDGEIE